MKPEIKHFKEVLSASPYKNFYDWTDEAFLVFFIEGVIYGQKNQNLTVERIESKGKEEEKEG